MKQPRDYQLACFDAIRSAFKRRLMRVIVVLATGLGKTVIFVLIACMVRTKGGRVLILVNRDVLCDQAALELVANGLHPAIERGADKASPMSELVVGSIQTMCGQRLLKWMPEHFRMVICDEVHGSAAESFKAVLDHFKSAYHIGVTATPNRHDGLGLWNGYEEIVFEMPLYGRETEDGIMCASGVGDGWLCGLRFIEIPVPITLDDRIATKKTLSEAEESGEFGLDGYLKRIYESSGAYLIERKALQFFPNCKSSIEAAEAYRSMGLNARHIEGPGGPASMNKSQIAEIIEWYRHEKHAVLCNAELLAVGYNQPDIDTIGLIRLIKSETAYLQKLGRGTRVIADVDSLATREERLAAIYASEKPECIVLDLCIQNKEHNLATPACLVTDNSAEKAALREARKSGKSIDVSQMETLLRAKRETDRDAAMAVMAEQVANAAKKTKKGKEPYYGHILLKPDGASLPCSDAAMRYLRSQGYTGTTQLTKQKCYLITELFKKHKQKLQLA
jgi:superfamily II DNA or RNA helicase